MTSSITHDTSGLLAFVDPSAGPSDADRPHIRLEDRIAIADVIGKLGLAADQHDWSAVEAAFEPRVTTDYVSLFGGEPQSQPRTDLVAGWRGMLPGFDATQHLVTTTEVRMRDPHRAVAHSNVRATHRLGNALWVVGGLYTHDLVLSREGWRISLMRFSLAYEEGDRALVAQAAERVSATG